MRINIFEAGPRLFHNVVTGTLLGEGSLHILGVEIPGSISFNNVAMIFSGSGAVSENLTLSLGLYSLNGSTLSLANSASAATGLTLNQTAFSWLTFATSATQDITPGNWYFAAMSSTSLGGGFSLVKNAGVVDLASSAHGGIFVRGIMTVSTNAMPASIATSDLYKEGDPSISAAIAGRTHPYILISA